tara:strand:- start:319 stop:765 length:447 start_codon:yes stop_codon:yes gene_type:complete
MGDPETQNLMITLENKNIDLLEMILNNPITDIRDLNVAELDQKNNEYCCTIVLAAKGYPNSYEKGFYIDTSNIKENLKVKIFHAGTILDDDKICVIGGRILTVNAFSEDKEKAINIAYENIKNIRVFEDKDMSIENNDLVFFREDIGS